MKKMRSTFVAQLMADYGQPLRHFLARKLGNKWDAEEVAQEAFLKVHVLADNESIEYPRPLLYRIANNLALNRIRHERVRARSAALLEHQHDLVDFEESPESQFDNKVKLSQLKTVILELPPRCREAFIRHRFRGQDYDQIAEEMNISKSMIKKHISRAVRICMAKVGSE